MQRLLPTISTQLVYTGVFVLLLFVLFFRTHRVFPKMIYLMNGQVPAKSLFFNIQACSMRKLSADQSSKYSESHFFW